jgi:hypothetical protein
MNGKVSEQNLLKIIQYTYVVFMKKKKYIKEKDKIKLVTLLSEITVY